MPKNELKNTNSLLCGGVKPGNPRCLLSGSRGKYTVNFYHPYISLIIVEYRSLCSYIITYIIISFYFSLSGCCPNVHKFTAESQVSRIPGWILILAAMLSFKSSRWKLGSCLQPQSQISLYQLKKKVSILRIILLLPRTFQHRLNIFKHSFGLKSGST